MDTEPTPDQLSQMRGCLASPAWRLLLDYFQQEHENIVLRVMRIEIDPDESLVLRARDAGRKDVLGWFESMIGDAGWSLEDPTE